MDGYELMRQVRSGGTTIPAIRSHGFRWFRRPNAVLQAGFNMYLVKPLEPQELVKVVATLSACWIIQITALYPMQKPSGLWPATLLVLGELPRHCRRMS